MKALSIMNLPSQQGMQLFLDKNEKKTTTLHAYFSNGVSKQNSEIRMKVQDRGKIVTYYSNFSSAKVELTFLLKSLLIMRKSTLYNFEIP